jgi:hypothetical protein
MYGEGEDMEHISMDTEYAKNIFLEMRKPPSQQVLRLQGQCEQLVHDLVADGPIVEESVAEAEVDTANAPTPTLKQGSYPVSKKRKTSEVLVKHIHVVEQFVPKHGKVRQKIKGNGATSAILTDVDGFRNLLETALCFHSFIHYFGDLPKEMREDHDLIGHSVRSFVELYNTVVYQGDNTVDCDTCKIHAHLHVPKDIIKFGNPMNWDAGKGERGLKVWAKLCGMTS